MTEQKRNKTKPVVEVTVIPVYYNHIWQNYCL